jgi:hypothetical protein
VNDLNPSITTNEIGTSSCPKNSILKLLAAR